MIYHGVSQIVHAERLASEFFTMRLDAPEIATSCMPGQFILLRGLEADWPYLRRPFSIYMSDSEAVIDIVYKVVGRATAIMSGMSTGTPLDIIGPLGKGFAEDSGCSHLIALAGGIGVPPIAFYCQKFAGLHDGVTLIVGAKARAELLVPTGLMGEGVGIEAYTEDGSKGAKGTVCNGLEKALARLGRDTGSVKVIACGPREMLLEVAAICRDRDVLCEVSVEAMMACGVGACLSCAVPAAGGGYLHACQDGPVFDSGSIDWQRWREA
jgi:dihydroorotate dehydrogenase electron transfer subunit